MDQANMPPSADRAVSGTSTEPIYLTSEVTTSHVPSRSPKIKKKRSKMPIGESTTKLLVPVGDPDRAPTEDLNDQEPWGDELVGGRLSQYRIESHLGRGSMARVFKARHLGLERICALKIMNPRLISSQEANRDQFWAEARAAANLIHPHVVTIYNLGSDQGYDFIEMEYVAGAVSLRDCLIHRGPLHPVRAARLVRQVALALHEAHRSGIIHRDVKPANVLLTSHGHAKLADFGLAQRLLGLPSRRLAGTPSFMAPELFKGTPASPQSDLYAVGVMLYYLVSGLLPFAAPSIKALIQLHHTQPVPDLHPDGPAIPEGLLQIIERCLAKSPSHRFASALELADELRLAIQRLRDTESLIRESVRGLDCFVQGARESFRILLPQQKGQRLQEVLIEVNEGKETERFLSVFSVCGPAEPTHHAAALALNARLTYGSISIRHVLGAPMFVMTRTFSRDRVRPSELRAAIIEIARRSDQIEQQITQLDVY
jgi:eukaryotic-like serine/threonine-protein kinase